MNHIVSVERLAGGAEIVVEFADESLSTFTVDELATMKPGVIPEEPTEAD